MRVTRFDALLSPSPMYRYATGVRISPAIMTELDGRLNRSLLFELLNGGAVQQHRQQQQQDRASSRSSPHVGGAQPREGFEQRARQYGESSDAIMSALRLKHQSAPSPSEPLPHLCHAGQAAAVLDPVVNSMDKVGPEGGTAL